MIDYKKYHGITYEVDLAQRPSRRWLPTVGQLREEIAQTMSEVFYEAENFVNDYLSKLSPLYRNVIRLLISGGMPVVGTLYRIFGEEYVRELESIAKHVDISFSKLLLSNLSYDLAQYSKFHYACSSFSYNLKGAPVLARNLDWAWPETLGHHTIIVRFRKRQHEYYAVTFPGFVGVLSAMSPGKWAITVNMAPQVISPKVVKLPALMLTRRACDSSRSYNSLVKNILRMDTQTSFFVHIIGTRKTEHCVIEKEPGYNNIRKGELPLLQTNHFTEDEDRNPSAGFEGDIIYKDSYPRFRSLKRRLRKIPKSLKNTLKYISAKPVNNKRTMQSMVLYPKTGRLHLKIRPIRYISE
jgi:hypothetical protein